MNRVEAIEIINRENDPNDKKVWELFPEYREALDMAIQALSQEPSRDIEEIAEVIKSNVDAETKCKMISNILTAKPHYFEISQEPKTGHWIKWYEQKEIDNIPHCKCSECDTEYDIFASRFINYCPNCGARMESEV